MLSAGFRALPELPSDSYAEYLRPLVSTVQRSCSCMVIVEFNTYCAICTVPPDGLALLSHKHSRILLVGFFGIPGWLHS